MTLNDDINSLLSLAVSSIQSAQAKLGTGTTQTAPPAITTADQFDAAYAAAAAGAVLTLDPTFSYTKPLVLNKAISLVSSAAVTARAGTAAVMPTFAMGTTIAASKVTLSGVAFQRLDGSLLDILTMQGVDGITLDGCRVYGSPQGQKRGILGNASNLTLTRCYVANIWKADQDGQALLVYDTPGPITIDDCYFSGSGETVLFGGADSATAAGIPTGITIKNSTLTKDPAWKGTVGDVKNTLELKCAKNVLVENCDISQSWAAGQAGFLLVLTPRNQGNTAPWSTVDGVVIQNNLFHDGAAWLSLLGSDNDYPSGPLQNITIRNNKVVGLDPAAFSVPGTPGAPQVILVSIQKGYPQHVTIDSNVIAGQNMTTAVDFDGDGSQCADFNVTNNTFPACTQPQAGGLGGYGVRGAGTASSTLNGGGVFSWGLGEPPNQAGAWIKFVSSGTLSGNVAA